jgi:hypothetical protein
MHPSSGREHPGLKAADQPVVGLDTSSQCSPHRVGMPGEEFYKVATTVVVRSDPVQATAAAE